MICWLHNGIYNRCCLCEWSHAPLVILVREIVLITIDHHWVYYAAVHWDRALWPTSCRCGRGNLRRNDSEPNWIKRQNGNTWPFVPFDPLSPNSILNLHSKVKLNCMRRPPKKKQEINTYLNQIRLGEKGAIIDFGILLNVIKTTMNDVALQFVVALLTYSDYTVTVSALTWLQCWKLIFRFSFQLSMSVSIQPALSRKPAETGSSSPRPWIGWKV